jgi:hypothetical protein
LIVCRRLLPRPPTRLLSVLAAVLVCLALARYVEVTAPALYGRGVNLYWDAQHLPAVAAMLASSAPTILVAGSAVVFAALLWILFRLLRWSLASIVGVLDDRRAVRGLQIGATSLVALYLLGYHTSLPTLQWFSIPVTQTYARQLAFVRDALAGRGAVAELPRNSTLLGLEPGELPGSDVLVSFIESYGAVAYDDEALSAALEAPRRDLRTAVESTGRRVVSAFVEPPTVGGGSWLSHISFMSGLWIAEPARYDALLTQERVTLPKLFRRAGHRTIALMPGLRSAWPEGSFYGFDVLYGAEQIAYPGPDFGWWRIPDQYALARLYELELAAESREPVFVFFPTISTHMPFRPTPPYQGDWNRLLSPAPYTPEQLGGALDKLPEWLNLRPAYADALAYTYAYWSGYLRKHPDDDLLLLLVGDHQPAASVSGQEARWDVPVHVIARDAAFLEHLVELGFEPGLQPPAETWGGMHELARIFESG